MKTKLILGLFLFLIAGTEAYSQTYRILAKPMDAKEWGYTDLKGDFVISPQFKNCIGFSKEGLAAVYDSKAKRFYFIKPNGDELNTDITGFKLIEIFGFGMKGFKDGFAPVKFDDKWGFLNTEGKMAIPNTFDKVTQFGGGYATGKKGDNFYVVDKGANEIKVDVPLLKDVNDFSEGLASYQTTDDLAGFIDGTGKIAIPAKFRSVGDFSGGLAWAKDVTGSVGYINSKGEWAVPPKFDVGKNYDKESDLARVKMGDTWAYTNDKGDLTFMKDTDIFEDFSNGLARGKKGGKFGFFDTKGEWSIQPQFDGARDFKNGYASVKQGDKWGVIDVTGKWVIEPKFNDIKDVEIMK